MPESKQELVAVRVGHQPGADVQQKQRRQMLIALGILLLAVVLLLLKDWHYWFPQSTAPVATEQLERSIVNPAPTAAKVNPPSTAKGKAPAAATVPIVPPPVVATDRAVLPPLEVEVVTGNRRHAVKTGTNSVRVDMQSETE